MGLMRKLMSFDEFAGNGNPSNEMNSGATKQQQFHPFPSNGAAGGLFNGKFSNTTNFPFLFDGKQQQHQTTTNNMRHEGLLKPCYDFPSKSAVEGLDDGAFVSSPLTAGGLRKQQQLTSTSTSSSSHGFTSGGFNQFSHDPLFGANNHHHHSNFTKLNEINNNNSSSNGMVGGGNGIISTGIVIKTENGINDYHHNSIAGTNNSNVGSSSAMQMNSGNNSKANENLCSRSSNAMNAKTEPNEFKSNSCKGNLDNSHHPHHDDDDGNERKSMVAADESADGFTQL